MEIDKELLEDFESHRKEIKKPLTDRAKKILIRKLKALSSEGYDVNILLEDAIINGWQSIWPNENAKRKMRPASHKVGGLKVVVNSVDREGGKKQIGELLTRFKRNG